MRSFSSSENSARRERAQPLGGHLAQELREALLGAAKHLGEHPIEAVVVALVLHQAGAREVVEVLCRNLRDARAQRLEQHQELGDRDRHARPRAARRRNGSSTAVPPVSARGGA